MSNELFTKNRQLLVLNRQRSIQSAAVIGIGLGLACSWHNPVKAAGIVGNGTAASCTDTAFNNALNGGGNVIFNCGSRPVTIAIASQKVISRDTTIDGRNLVTISGSNSRRLFLMQGDIKFTVKNLTLANGYTTDRGAAISKPLYGELIVSNSRFNNNVSTSSKEAGGGAIHGGPIGSVSVDRSTFTNNKAGQGGAIAILNSDLQVTNSSFANNQAVNREKGSGGGIYIDGAYADFGKISISGSTFTNNTATSYGGGLFITIKNNNKATVDRSKFIGNRVGGGSNGQGGGIWTTGDPALGGHWKINANNTTMAVTNTTISGNTANTQGGGIWIAKHPAGITISNTTISGNVANTSNGGGIVLGDNSKLNITNSTISDNRVLGRYSLGGGILINSGTATIANTTIAGNYAIWQGGGLVRTTKVPKGNVVVKNTIIANNVANNGGNNWNIKHNCFNQMTNGGNNLQFPARNLRNSQDVDCTANILTADPKLDVLKNNGGLTLTRALLTGSAAANRGTGCPATDQRGVNRRNPCDLGAFEAGF
jgi:parallel beta-helix repeat protein